MYKKIMTYTIALALVVCGITFTPNTTKKVSAAADPSTSGWQLQWSDEFEGSSLDTSSWSYETGAGGWGNSELQYYTSRTSNVAVTGGNLKITAKKESYEGSQYTSGRIITKNKRTFKYGKMEARLKVEGGNQNGVWPAFWMMGNDIDTNTWPKCGELDIMEHANDRNYTEGTLHWGPSWDSHSSWGSYSDGSYNYYASGDGITNWHTYGVTWDENQIKWYMDDVVFLTANISSGMSSHSYFTKDAFFLLNLALGSSGTGYTGNTPPDSNFQSATMYVDYVRAYTYNGEPETEYPADYTEADTDGSWHAAGTTWNYLFNKSWASVEAAYKGGDSLGDFSVYMTNGSSQEWGAQIKPTLSLAAKTTYNYSLTINTDASGDNLRLRHEGSSSSYIDLIDEALVSGTKTYSGSFTTGSSSAGVLIFALGNISSGKTFTITNFAVWAEGETTAAPVTTTTAEPTSTAKPTTTTAAPTTTAKSTTTVAPQTTTYSSNINASTSVNVDSWSTFGIYKVQCGTWAGSTSASAGVDSLNDSHIKVVQTASSWNSSWLTQVCLYLPELASGYSSGIVYHYEWDIKAQSSDGTVQSSDGSKGDENSTSLTGSIQTLTGALEYKDDQPALVLGLGWVGINNAVDVYCPRIYNEDNELVWPVSQQQTTTAAPTTTVKPTTTVAPTTTVNPADEVPEGFVAQVVGQNVLINYQSDRACKLFVDGSYDRDVTNGMLIPITNYTAGQHSFVIAYKLDVAPWEGNKTSAVYVTIPEPETETPTTTQVTTTTVAPTTTAKPTTTAAPTTTAKPTTTAAPTTTEAPTQQAAPSGFTATVSGTKITFNWVESGYANLYVDGEYYNYIQKNKAYSDTLFYGTHSYEIALITSDSFHESLKTDPIEITVEEPTTAAPTTTTTKAPTQKAAPTGFSVLGYGSSLRFSWSTSGNTANLYVDGEYFCQVTKNGTIAKTEFGYGTRSYQISLPTTDTFGETMKCDPVQYTISAPTTTEAPTTTVKPTTTVAPTTTAKPTTTAAPTTTAKPTTTAAPTTTAKPTTTVAPTTTEAQTEGPVNNWISCTDRWLHRQADGSFVVEDGADYNAVQGITAIYCGSWGSADIDVSNQTTDMYSLPINVLSAGVANQDWCQQLHVNKTGLDSAKTYSIKLKANGTVLFEDTTDESSSYSKTINLAGKLDVGQTTLTFEVNEIVKPDDDPDVQDINIRALTDDIEANGNLWADWVNPEGTAKAYVYLGQVDNDHAAATLNNGWIFNDQATQPMTKVDKVARTRDGSITIEVGETYTLIVEAYNAFDQKVGYGTKEITITEPEVIGGDVEFYDSYRQDLTQGENTYYAIYTHWNKVPGAAGYKSYINEETNDKKAVAANGWCWSDQGTVGSTDTWVDTVIRTKDGTYLEDNTTYTLIVVAYDHNGDEIGRGTQEFAGKVAPTTTTVAPTTTTVVPTTTAKPTTTVAPTTTAEPTTTAAPTTTAKPTTTVAPTTTVKPTTTVAPTTTAEPTTQGAVDPYSHQEWKAATDGSDYKICIVDKKTTDEFNGVFQKEGTSLYIAGSAAILKPDYKSASLNGNALDIWAGAYVRVPIAGLDENADNTLVITDTFNNEYTIIIRSGNPYPDAPTEAPEPQGDEWINVTGGGTQWYYNDTTKIKISQVVSVQKPGFADQQGIYLTVPAGISEVSINGVSQSASATEQTICGVQGAGVVVFLSAMTSYTNEIAIKNGTNISYIQIRNVLVTEPKTGNQYDVEVYKTNEIYPTKDGLIFAGWFSDADYTSVYEGTSGNAYAKFIDAKVLTFKHQWGSNHSALRFVSTIDSLDYQSVGFTFSGTYGSSTIKQTTKAVEKVYTKITADSQSVLPNVFSDDSEYFFTYTIRGMDGTKASTWNVTPYYVTLDGTTVIGKSGTVEYTP